MERFDKPVTYEFNLRLARIGCAVLNFILPLRETRDRSMSSARYHGYSEKSIDFTIKVVARVRSKIHLFIRNARIDDLSFCQSLSFIIEIRYRSIESSIVNLEEPLFVKRTINIFYGINESRRDRRTLIDAFFVVSTTHFPRANY